MPRFVDISGQLFGRLTAVSRAENAKNGHTRWLCKCECGNTTVVDRSNLSSGQIKSCGCWHRESRPAINRTHGHSAGGKISGTYRSWQAAINRCTNPKNPKWSSYGGRGIKICERWMNSFEAFLADMGERPLGMTLDRYPDNDGNYEPGNCRWADAKAQSNNTRRNALITAFGRTQTLAQWRDELDGFLSETTIQSRLRRGWEPERALSQPADPADDLTETLADIGMPFLLKRQAGDRA